MPCYNTLLQHASHIDIVHTSQQLFKATLTASALTLLLHLKGLCAGSQHLPLPLSLHTLLLLLHTMPHCVSKHAPNDKHSIIVLTSTATSLIITYHTHELSLLLLCAHWAAVTAAAHTASHPGAILHTGLLHTGACVTAAHRLLLHIKSPPAQVRLHASCTALTRKHIAPHHIQHRPK
jgi:hypothetical protein